MPEFNWKIALYKAAKAALASGLTILIVNGDLDKLLDLVKSGIHVPFYMAPVVAVAVTLVRNYLKQLAVASESDNSLVKLVSKS